MDRTYIGYNEIEARSLFERERAALEADGWRVETMTATKEVRRLRQDRVHVTVTFGRARSAAPQARPGAATRAYVRPADRPYGETTCPTCGRELDPLPKRKMACPHCGAGISVRSGPDGKRHLLNDDGVLAMQEAWEIASRDRAASGEPADIGNRPRTPRIVNFEVVGESNYQGALEAACGGRSEDAVNHPCVVSVTLEPLNPYDRRAVRIDLDGDTVGYLSRASARAFEPVAAVLAGRSLTCPARIVGGWQRGFDFGSFGIIVELPPAEELVERVRRGHIDLTVDTP